MHAFKQHLERAGLVSSEHHGDKIEAAGRVLLGRVRAARVAADLLRRPGHPRGRSPEERQRTGPAAGRGRAALSQRLLPAVPARPTAGSRRRIPELDFYNLAVEPMRYTDGSPVHVRVDLPDNAVFCKVWKAQRRPHSALPARHEPPGERAGRSRHHRPPVRRRAPSCASSRRSSSASAASARWRR